MSLVNFERAGSFCCMILHVFGCKYGMLYFLSKISEGEKSCIFLTEQFPEKRKFSGTFTTEHNLDNASNVCKTFPRTTKAQLKSRLTFLLITRQSLNALAFIKPKLNFYNRQFGPRSVRSLRNNGKCFQKCPQNKLLAQLMGFGG